MDQSKNWPKILCHTHMCVCAWA